MPLIEINKNKPDLRKKEPPLVDLKVTNPVTYLKSWWKRVMGGEGVDLHFRIKPLTAIAITIIIATFGFGVGRITVSAQKPFINFQSNPTPTPIPIPNPWRETAFSGSLQFSQKDSKFYLLTTSSEAITLQIPENVELTSLIGRRIFATGRYNENTRVLLVSETSDLEILPKKVETVPVKETVENNSLTQNESGASDATPSGEN